MNTIRKKMLLVAKELSQDEEIGLDEQTLMRIFENKTEKLSNLLSYQANFEEGRNSISNNISNRSAQKLTDQYS